MKIKSVEARNISIPLNRPIHNPAFKFTHCKYTIVTVTTDEESRAGAFRFGMHHKKAVVDELAEILVGRR